MSIKLSGPEKYQWHAEGIWIGDGHNWNLGMDSPQQPRISTGETVVLQPPRLAFDQPSPVECTIYKLRDYDVYIAIGEYKGVPVLFYDMISYSAEYQRRHPTEDEKSN